MSSEEFTDILQHENLETLIPRASDSKRSRHELSNWQNLIPNEPVIELESDTDTNSQRKPSRKHNKYSAKIDLNKITDQLVLIPNAKPPG